MLHLIKEILVKAKRIEILSAVLILCNQVIPPPFISAACLHGLCPQSTQQPFVLHSICHLHLSVWTTDPFCLCLLVVCLSVCCAHRVHTILGVAAAWSVHVLRISFC